jgi:hypothetical protein
VKGSVQRIALEGPVVESTERGAASLADAYWAEIRRRTAGLVRARRSGDGVELRLVGLALFRFGAPHTTAEADRIECRFPIAGGLLAKQEGGSLTFVQCTAPEPELLVSVDDYLPSLSSRRERHSVRHFFYRQVQERAHAAISHRYLERMAAESR